MFHITGQVQGVKVQKKVKLTELAEFAQATFARQNRPKDLFYELFASAYNHDSWIFTSHKDEYHILITYHYE
jgi:hypothetical protein